MHILFNLIQKILLYCLFSAIYKDFFATIINMIVVYNSKGGVGKSALSYSLSTDLETQLLSNDENQFLGYHPESKLYLNETMPIIRDAVYDLGGFETPFIEDVLEAASVIIIPVTVDFNSMKRGVQILKEFKHKKLLLVANQIENTDDFDYIKEIVKREVNTVIYPLKRSIIFRRSLETGMSVKQLYEESGLSKYSYRGIFKQYEAILKSLENSQ